MAGGYALNILKPVNINIILEVLNNPFGSDPSTILVKMSVTDIGLILSTFEGYCLGTGTTIADLHWLETTPSKEYEKSTFQSLIRKTFYKKSIFFSRHRYFSSA